MKTNTYRALRTIVHSFGKVKKNHTIDTDEQTAAELVKNGQLEKVLFSEGAIVVTDLEDIEDSDSKSTEELLKEFEESTPFELPELPEFETSAPEAVEDKKPEPKPKKGKGK